ncbi:MAG TPA: succinate dehydrogenase cytochrome b subunit [Gemmatimonadales bacterium]|nr:succinate dehydrogenase cytochrome b subunit [Gemmatimonadales bacterium]
MSSTQSLTRSLIGQKVLMAVSGVVLLLFVFAHMAGNLHFFEGPQAIADYAKFLRTVGAPVLGYGQALWIVRAVLIVALAVHILAAWSVTRASWAARPVGYRRLEKVETTYAARTMRWGGVIILLFVIFHLMDLTFGSANPSYVHLDPYHNMVASFTRWPVAVSYLVAMGVLCLHMYHGIYSGFQTLGLNHPRYNRFRRGLAVVYAGVVAAGFASVPLSILAGWMR